jgi:UDP-N-acetylglucosamine 2-epimerase
MSAIFFEELGIPKPYTNLQVGSSSHAEQTAQIMVGVENLINETHPDAILIYGDTNSTLAGALAASKLNIPISHIEAGLRSFNRRMPEEVNSVLTDHCSSLLFAPTESAMFNLRKEGLGDSAVLSGDVMVESLNFITSQSDFVTHSENYLFATIHRAENTDTKERITKIIFELRQSQIPVHLHCHPRLKKVLEELGIFHDSENLKFLSPLDYFSTIKKISNSVGVITDSGGLQKEAYILGKPCLVVRSESEWVEALSDGSNFLDPNLESVQKNWWSENKPKRNINIFGDGKSSHTIISAIESYKSANT